MTKRREEDTTEQQPPSWLKGEWVTWWDSLESAKQPWSLHLARLDDGEYRFWLCRNDNDEAAQRMEFNASDAETLIEHLDSALEVARRSV